MPPVNPIAVLCLSWIPVLLISGLPGLIFPVLDTNTYLTIVIGLGAACSGSFVGWALVRSSTVPKIESTVHVSTRALVRWHMAGVALLAIYVLYQGLLMLPVVERIGGFGALLSDGGRGFRAAQAAIRADTLGDGFANGGLLVAVLGYVAYLGYVSLFTGALLWWRGRRVLATIPLVLLGAVTLITFQRTSFVIGVLIAVTALALSRGRSAAGKPGSGLASRSGRKPLAFRIAAASTAVAAAAAIVLVPLQLRNAGTTNSTGLRSLFEYLVSGVAGLQARFTYGANPELAQSLDSSNFDLGTNSFSGLFGILSRLGFPVDAGAHSLEYYTVSIAGRPFATNVATGLNDYLMDFGILGLVAIPFLLGGVAAASVRLIGYGRTWLIPIASLALVALFWSFLVNTILKDVRYAMLAVVASCLLAFLGRKPSLEAAEPEAAAHEEHADPVQHSAVRL
ncbi:O-antigen polymerase [Microterricola pindariensis]|nr:O-antigen polymerase [Microterricola pindariensis]